jgi:hypothetical protein
MSDMKRNVLKKLLHARRLQGGKSLWLQSGAVLLSMLTLSFFLCLFADLQGLSLGHSVLPFGKFLRDLISATRAVAALLILPSLLSFYLYSSMRRGESVRFYTTLLSLGATRRQLAVLATREITLLYLLPASLGALLGILPARLFFTALAARLGISPGGTAAWLLCPLLLLLGAGLSFLFGRVPLPRENAGLIAALRGHNQEEAEEAHHYRRSYTFRYMPPVKRLAKKSVDYYKKDYRRIAMALASLALYPLLSVVFFLSLSGSSITVGAGEALSAVEAAGDILLFVAASFALLCAIGVGQVAYMVRLQNERRRKTLRIYTAVGMTEKEARGVLTYEHRTVLLHAFVYVVFAAVMLWGLI